MKDAKAHEMATFGAELVESVPVSDYGCVCADVAGWEVLHPELDETGISRFR